MLRTIVRKIWDLLYPQDCLQCGRPALWLCDPCLQKMMIRNDEIAVPYLDKTYIACDYTEEIKKLMWLFKYANQPQISELLSHILARRLETVTRPRNLRLVPVPLTISRQKFRGYNQAELLARHLELSLHIPVALQLRRIKHVRHQARLGKTQRLKNAADSFAAVPCEPGLTYLIIDDVLTTGATMSVAAHALRQAGAVNVWGIAVSRNDRSQISNA